LQFQLLAAKISGPNKALVFLPFPVSLLSSRILDKCTGRDTLYNYGDWRAWVIVVQRSDPIDGIQATRYRIDTVEVHRAGLYPTLRQCHARIRFEHW